MKLEAKSRLTAMRSISLQAWKHEVTKVYQKAKFTQDTGRGNTYGTKGDWTAHTGPDMQADVVGVYAYSTESCWWFVGGEEPDVVEYETEGKPLASSNEGLRGKTPEEAISDGSAFDTLIDGNPGHHSQLVQDLLQDDGGFAPADEQPLLMDDIAP